MLNQLIKSKICRIIAISIGFSFVHFSTAYAEEVPNNPIDQDAALCMERDYSTLGIIQCSREAEEKWDKELNRLYKLLYAKLNEQGKKSLKASQKQWLEHRDAEFQAFVDIYGAMDGSMWKIIAADARAELVKKRVLDFQTYLDMFEVNAPMSSLSFKNSLCNADEKIIFNCQIKKKTLSVCASQDLTQQSGYLQYRFGSVDNVEMQLPKNTSNSQSVFKFSHYTRPLITYLSLSVKSGQYNYKIYSDYNSEKGKGRAAHGIVVTLPSGKESNLACTASVIDNLTELEGIVANER